MNDAETIQLSAIFNRLLLDLESAGNFDLRSDDRDAAMNLLRTAVVEAVAVVGQRCSKCDSDKLICIDCGDIRVNNEVVEYAVDDVE